jgi:hypothetical protein
MEFNLNTRVIDLTLGELGEWMKLTMAEAVKTAVSNRPVAIEGIHPETGLPEGPLEYVSDKRACEILGTAKNPVAMHTLYKYKQKPVYGPTGVCLNGGRSLPASKTGPRCQYQVCDLLALKKDKHHFSKPGRNKSR